VCRRRTPRCVGPGQPPDLSRVLILPLRLAQFQFDLDLSTQLVLNMELIVWVGVNAVWLLVVVSRRLTGARRAG
jgi:hypothetical protein